MGYVLTQIARFFEGLMVSIGEHLTLSVAGIFFLGFPVTFSFSAYAYTILARQGTPLWLAIATALAGSGVVGVLFALLYRRLSNDSFAVFTLASVLAFSALVSSWESLTGGVLGIPGVPVPPFARGLSSLTFFEALLSAVLVAGEYFLLRSSFGRSLQAHKESKTFLDSLGTDSRSVGSIVVVLSSLLGAVGGLVTIWRIQFIDPTFGGVALLLQILTISILAVRPRVGWLMGATAVIVFLPEALSFFPFPSSVLGPLRLLVYAVFLMILINRFSANYTSEKRFV